MRWQTDRQHSFAHPQKLIPMMSRAPPHLAPAPGTALTVKANGQLGVAVLAQRHRTDIAPLAGATAVRAAWPVRFHLGSAPGGAILYGLIGAKRLSQALRIAKRTWRRLCRSSKPMKKPWRGAEQAQY
jgi:hypothetical protein